MASIGRGIKAFGKLIWRIVTFPFRLLWRCVCAVGRGIRAVFRAIIATPGKTIRGIIRFGKWLYRTALMIRTKVEYLQTESQKWKVFFSTLKAPYSLLRMLGFSPQMALTFLTVGTVAGGAVGVTEVLADKSFSAGDPGIYTAPTDQPIFFEDEFNTLKLDLGTTPVGLIEISDTTVGTAYTGSTLPSGETNGIIIGGMPAVVDPAFTETYLLVGHMIVDRWRCKTLTLTNIEAHELIIQHNSADGISIAPVAGIPRNRGINGGNRAEELKTAYSTYDQIKLTAATSGVNGQVDVLRLTNLYTREPCVIDRVKAGTLEITLNEIGGDTDLATKALVVSNSVVYKKLTNTDNIEVSMTIPAIQ